MASRTVIATSDAVVLDAATELIALGNAVDVVVGAVYFAAAARPTVLLGPVQLLLGGAGMGLLAVDGRLRQPGRGAARPRGFVEGDAIPPAAHVAVPTLPAALAATLALASGATSSRVMRPAIAHAKAVAKERAPWLERIARRGAAALADGPLAAELVAAAGRMAAGTLTLEDLGGVRPAVVPCATSGDPPRRLAVAPWAPEPPQGLFGGSATQVVAAVDGRGRLAIACYEATPVEDAVLVAPELYAPRAATPVRRGETRVRPGEPCVASSPMALLEADGVLQAAAGGEGLSALAARFAEGLPLDGMAGATGVVRTRDGGRAFGGVDRG